MKKKYPYSQKRAEEHPGNLYSATIRQIWFIKKLVSDLPDDDYTLPDVLESVGVGLDDLTVGQASFVIKCLRGEIQPYEEEETTEDHVKWLWDSSDEAR